MKRSSKSVLATLVVAAGSMVGGLGVAAPAQAAGYIDPHCRSNGTTDGCVHLNMNNGVRYAWYHYGAHNVSGVKGTGVILNDQTGGAVAYACSAYNGKGTCKLIRAGDALAGDLTWVYSVYMSAHPTS